MIFKTFFMLLVYISPMYLFCFRIIYFTTLILWGLIGFGMSGIGLSVMHDANHNAYSKNKKLINGLDIY